jgi:TPR repeat protein
MFRTNAKMKNDAEKLYQNAMLMINGEIESDFMLENLLTQAARLQHAYAAGELGIHLFYAADTEAQYKKAVEYLLLGINGGHLLSRIYYAYCLNDGLGVLRNKVKAAQELEIFINDVKTQKQKNTWSTQITQTRLQEHYCIALTGLAHKYVNGEGVGINQVKAISLLTIAESLGSKVAKLDYAILIFQGVKTAKNDQEKNQRLKIWLQKLTELAQDNYSEAQQDLAIYYYYGNPLFPNSTKDVETAKLLFWNAALGGKHDCFYHLSQIYLQANNIPLAVLLLKIGALTGSKLAMMNYGKTLYQDENSTPEEKVIGINYIKTIADTGEVSAEYLYASIMLQVYNPDVHDRGNEGLLAEALTYLRKAVRSYQLAKLELAEVLIAHPGKNISAAFAEARQNLQEMINHHEEKSSLVYQSFIGLQQEAHALLAKVPELEEKAQLKSQALIEIDNKIEDNLEKPEPAVKKKSRSNKPNKLTKFPPLHPRRLITYPKDEPEAALENEIKPEEHAPCNLPIIEITPAPEVVEVKPDIPLAPELIAPVYARLPKPLPEEVRKVLKLLESQGYRAYVVGGLTRNILLGIDSLTDDIDIVTDAPLAITEKLFNECRHLHVPNLVRFTKDNRSFDIVHVSNLKTDMRADALNRDFTINALYADAEGNVTDPLGRGLQDLNHPECQLQTILPAEECFKTDGFRILRYLHFLSKQFTGALIPAQIVKFMQDLRLTLADYKEKAVSSDTHLCKKVSLYEIFDSLICKFFMNGKSLKMFELLNTHYFFAIFFHADLVSDDQNWLRWRFQKMDEDGRFTKNRLYGMLLAAMLKNNTFCKADITAMLDAGPYPCTLRWYNPLLEEVQVWLNEKTIFDCLPANFRQALYEKTNSELSLTRNQRGISFASHSPPTLTKLPMFFKQKLYQQTGQFGHATSHFQAADSTSLLPMPTLA